MSQRSESAVLGVIDAAFPQLLPWNQDRDRVTDPALGVDPAALSLEALGGLVSSRRWGPWTEALERVGNCAHPVRMRGHSVRVDPGTGEVLSTYSSTTEPLGVTHVRCGNRRASRCPSCARLYAGDTWHLIHAGVVGGRTVPERVAENPLVFATLTAPSFGKVHTRRDATGVCHPAARGPGRCVHGRPRTCTRRHDLGEESLGQPLCPDCYDYASQLVWQWWAPSLWQRFTIGLRRSIAKDVGVPATRLGTVARVQYAKVVEAQARGAIHFHALIRLDGPTSTPEGTAFAAAPGWFDAARLARHVEQATRAVRLTVPGVDADDPDRVLAFGVQVDARAVHSSRRIEDLDEPDPGLSPDQVSGYLAKYVTKSASDDPTRENDAHHRRLNATARRLADRAAATGDGENPYRLLRKWVHEYGYRGHFSTKSRSFSLTLGQIRRARQRGQAALAAARREGRTIDLAAMDAELLADDDAETAVVISQWSYAGSGWHSTAETTLALAAAASAREHAREKAQQRKHHNDSGR